MMYESGRSVLDAMHGRSVKRDYAEAAAWYGKAADQGHRDAQLKLAKMYALGRGVKRSLGEAVDLWWKSVFLNGNYSDEKYCPTIIGYPYDDINFA